MSLWNVVLIIGYVTKALVEWVLTMVQALQIFNELMSHVQTFASFGKNGLFATITQFNCICYVSWIGTGYANVMGRAKSEEQSVSTSSSAIKLSFNQMQPRLFLSFIIVLSQEWMTTSTTRAHWMELVVREVDE